MPKETTQGGRSLMQGQDVATGGADTDRGTWDNQCEFFLSCLGYAVGFGNMWRFPYLCYKNGGAAFLIPYVIMLLCAGLPLFFMEMVLGQYVSLGPTVLFNKLAPVFCGLGWATVIISLHTALSFNAIIAWAFFYIFSSFSAVLPWSHCDNSFNSEACYSETDALVCKNQSLHYYNRTCHSIAQYCDFAHFLPLNDTHCHSPANTSDVIPADGALPRASASEEFFKNRMLRMSGKTWDDLGGMQWEIVGCLALAWLLVGICIGKGIKSSGKAVYFTATFPYLILLALVIRGMTLEGAMLGIDFYLLKPNMTRLMEVEVWSDASVQIFYSLGVSFGCLITLSSYNKFKHNCMRDAIIIAFSNCMTSVFAGFAIFSILGFLAHELNVEVADVASSGSGLVFVVYPAALALMPLPQLWSVLFFLMLINVGLSSQFSMAETVTTVIFDQFEFLRPKKPLVMSAVCFILFLLGLTMCLEGGIFMFELFFWFSAGISVIIIGLIQILGVQYVYGFRNLMKNIKEMGISMPGPLYYYWASTWLVVTPISIGAICFFSFYYLVPAYLGDYVFPYEIQVLGWLLTCSSIGLAPIGAIYAICKRNSSWKSLFQTSPEFCPAHIRKLQKASKTSSVFRYTYENKGFDDIGLKDIE